MYNLEQSFPNFFWDSILFCDNQITGYTLSFLQNYILIG